ncbi:clarin-3 [Bombina bombina]|uniref:clarin-3 n=1 Tax=Bombina bombina TaxID=8345 RepID=UPI00235AC658|nr:clarin-3 [Bombina bombina]
MPSKQKTLLFLSGFVASIGSFALICTCLGTEEWVSTNINFIATNHSGYINVKLGLFQGSFSKFVTAGAGLGKQPERFQVLQKLNGSGSIIVTHILMILFQALSLLCTFMSSATTCLNSVSNPYVTFLGPLGVYIWVSISAVLILLTMILCAANMEINKLPKHLAEVLKNGPEDLTSTVNTYGYSFWLLLLSICLSIATIIVIYYYQHARYSKKKEHERPLENASKDVILF